MNINYIAGFFDGEGSIGIYKNGNGLFHLRTQLTQNCGRLSKLIMDYLVLSFGGHYSKQITLSGGIKFNWQLSSMPAMRFLTVIEPHLILKRDQATFAIAWQTNRPLPSRDRLGRIKKYDVDSAFDEKVSLLMKALKKKDIDVVMENQKDLVEVVHTLKQVMCIKGN